MFVYKVEVSLSDGNVSVIVLAETDEAAFGYVESHLVRHFVRMPEVREIAIVEKKRAEKGSGYVIETGV